MLQNLIREHGIRNALLTSIAPTGTISLVADNVSSGLEPVFSYSYNRTVLMPDGTRKTEEVSDYTCGCWYPRRRRHGADRCLRQCPDPDAGRPCGHAGGGAEMLDSSISKTINVPVDISFEDFKDVCFLPLQAGLQGLHNYQLFGAGSVSVSDEDGRDGF